MRRIPYEKHYQVTALPARGGKVAVHRYAERGLPRGIEDDQQVYLKENGDIERALVQSRVIKTVNEPVYNEAAFKKRKRPANWPISWTYPHNPTYAPLSDGHSKPEF